MDEDKIIKLVQKKFPVMNIVMDIDNIHEGNERTSRQIGDYIITIEFAPSTVLIREVKDKIYE